MPTAPREAEMVSDPKTAFIAAPPAPSGAARRRAVAFIVLIGSVSLFADMTYEGARAISGWQR